MNNKWIFTAITIADDKSWSEHHNAYLNENEGKDYIDKKGALCPLVMLYAEWKMLSEVLGERQEHAATLTKSS